MRPQIVAEEQRVTPVGAARAAHVEMRRPQSGGWAIVQLAPVGAIGGRRRNMVAVNIEGAGAADPRKGGVEDGDIERGHRYLRVNDVFSRQPRHGGRADVVNPQRGIAERPGEPVADTLELHGPLGAVVHNHNLAVPLRAQRAAPLQRDRGASHYTA